MLPLGKCLTQQVWLVIISGYYYQLLLLVIFAIYYFRLLFSIIITGYYYWLLLLVIITGLFDYISADSSNSAIPVSGNGSSKGSSEAFPFEYTSPVKTKIGLKLTRVYDVNNDTGIIIINVQTTVKHDYFADKIFRFLKFCVI